MRLRLSSHDHRFPYDIISQAVWLCSRCSFSLRSLFVPLAAALAVSCAGPDPTPPAEEAAAQPEAEAAIGEIVRLDPRVDALIPADAAIEKVAEGFTFIEGPV